MVKIQIKWSEGIGTCAGTIIASRYILTAAHCLWPTEGRIFEYAWIELGGFYNIDKIIEKNVSRIIIHPEYEMSPYSENDIALLETVTTIDLNIYTPVCLRRTTETFDWKMAEVLVNRDGGIQKAYRGLVLPHGYCPDGEDLCVLEQLGGIKPVCSVFQ